MTRFFCFGLLLFLPSCLMAARTSNVAPGHRQDLWDTATGFPGGYIYGISQTGDGYLWIATSKGLFQYDGSSFMSIRRSDSGADTNFPVLGLITDSTDQLWAVDDHTHLFRYSAGVLNGPLSDNGQHRYSATSVNKSRDGWLLFASELQGLIEYERGEGRQILLPGMFSGSTTAVTQSPDGTFWIGTHEQGLFHLDTREGIQPVQLEGLSDAKINCLLPISDSTLLIGTDKGLLTLHKGKLIPDTRPELSRREIFALANGKQGKVWIGTEGHVFKAEASDIAMDGKIDLLERFEVRGIPTALFEDRDGNLWIGEPETLERYRDTAFITYFSSTGLPCNNCGAIYVDRRDGVWFAPWDGGLFRLANDRIQQIEIAGLNNDTVYSIAGGADDEIWLGRKVGGVTRIHLQGDAMHAITYTRQNGLAQDAVDSIYQSPDGTVWAGTVSGGLSRFSRERWHTYTTQDGLPSNKITAITGDASGTVFVGTPSGLAEFRNNRWISYAAHNGLPPGTVESLLLDGSGTLWIGTSKGISFLRSGIVHVPLGGPDALYGNILGIAESDGWLWITTFGHVIRVRCAALLQGSFQEGDYREFGPVDGLPSASGVKRTRSIVLDNRGRIWFSLNHGISVLEPSMFAKPGFPVTVRLDGMLIDGKLVTAGGQIRVPPGRHRLTFRYAGVNVSNAESVRYRYRLVHVDSKWSEPTASREIDYTNIAPGRFRFEVTARNPDGIWSDKSATVDLQVEPAYYQALWFRISSTTAVILLAIGAYRLRLRRLRREERKLRDVIETIPTFAWSALPDGAEDFVNRLWQEYSGLSAKESAGEGWQVAVHPEDLKRHLEKWRTSLATGEPFENEVRYRRAADGQYRWFLARAIPLRDARKRIVKWYGISTDIEDRKRAEQERETLRSDLAHVNRVSLLGELTASLAHEIKQPITASVISAQTCLEWLKRDKPELDEARASTKSIVEAGQRAAGIIDRLRALYKKAPPQRHLVDINEIVREMVTLLRGEANEQGVSIRTDLAEIPKISADRVQLQQVLMNLMLNGIDAMKQTGGVLTINSQQGQDHRLIVSVRDTGLGLPTDNAEQIFNAFFTTKPQGSGMGLTISRSIVESHGGRLWATPNNGRGTTFHFTLPTTSQEISLPATGT